MNQPCILPRMPMLTGVGIDLTEMVRTTGYLSYHQISLC